jgi:hypothetical protein
MSAEDHALALPARAEHHAAHVLQRERQAPLLGEGELRLVERLVVRRDRGVRQPPEVVVEGLLDADAPGQRVGEGARVLQRL